MTPDDPTTIRTADTVDADRSRETTPSANREAGRAWHEGITDLYSRLDEHGTVDDNQNDPPGQLAQTTGARGESTRRTHDQTPARSSGSADANGPIEDTDEPAGNLEVSQDKQDKDEPEATDAVRAQAIADTKADIDTAYATGDPEKIASALRNALNKIEDRPERQTTWQTIAQERGGVIESFPNYEAAKRALGVVPGTEIHHLVEQAQAKPERSGFDLSRINSTDNLTRIPPEVHREVSKHYSRNVPGLGETLRDVLNGTSWEYQTQIGHEALDKQMKEYRDER